jgi:hypothetical protein
MSRLVMQLLVAAIGAYQLALRPILGGSCRFSPSCSDYAIEAIQRHGSLRGLQVTLRRVLRCHPFHAAGYDPVPSGKEG